MPLTKNQIIPLTIDTIASDGNGIGRFEGQAVFVPFTAPGDTLEAQIVKLQKNHAFARIKTILDKSPYRIQPDCPVSGVCGGCSFRHLSYQAELKSKQQFVQDAVSRIAKLPVQVNDILPSPQQDRYRNKVQYPVAALEDGRLSFGFYAQRSHRVVPCEDCKLQPSLLNAIAVKSIQLLQQRKVTAYNEETGGGILRHLYLRSGTNSGEVMLCLVASTPDIPDLAGFAHEITAQFPAIASLILNINNKNTNVICGDINILVAGKPTISDSLCEVPLQLSPLSFSQVNSKGAEQLFQVAKDYAAIKNSDILVDLYCGTGVIGLSMASDCKALIGVEIVPQAVESARASAAAMQLSNTQFYCEDAGAAASRLAQEGMRPQVVIVDPPRKGCDAPTLAAILEMAPERVVMVSCNPATMARDVAVMAQGGYAVQAVQPVDMFPRTRHVEAVVLMSRVEK